MSGAVGGWVGGGLGMVGSTDLGQFPKKRFMLAFLWNDLECILPTAVKKWSGSGPETIA